MTNSDSPYLGTRCIPLRVVTPNLRTPARRRQFSFILLPRGSITVLPKPVFCVVLPNSAVLIASLPNLGAVLSVEAKAVSGPESDDKCYSK